jgi:ABC-type polysaccharide/polyol phosphate transport system ATPase subunit
LRPAIRAEVLGKRYRIAQRQRYLALRDQLGEVLRSPLRLLKRRSTSVSHEQREIWALLDVAFQVERGEVIGVIGRNGAGKTTLLKLLSRVTEPSAGWVEICGSVGSLLEVGTGFHPELTGRENIYLNGAILGMSRREIGRKFDDIVTFAEVAEFLDTPLKHYSSGMQTRLAFAVAAHFEPEILLVDEVLAVGDLSFQRKCLGKMDEVARDGRTIIFVSHQMNQIRRLCARVIWIDGGRLRMDGPTAEVVSSYESAMARGDVGERQETRDCGAKTRFLRWQLAQPEETANRYHLDSLGEVTVHFDVWVESAIYRGHHGVALFNANRELIWGRAIDDLQLQPGLHRISYALTCLPLRPGPYFWQVSLWEDGERFDAWDCLPEMIVVTPNFQHPRDEWSGVLNIPSQVRITELEEVEYAEPPARAAIGADGSGAS